jgi:hypothetical protein
VGGTLRIGFRSYGFADQLVGQMVGYVNRRVLAHRHGQAGRKGSSLASLTNSIYPYALVDAPQFSAIPVLGVHSSLCILARGGYD